MTIHDSLRFRTAIAEMDHQETSSATTRCRD